MDYVLSSQYLVSSINVFPFIIHDAEHVEKGRQHLQEYAQSLNKVLRERLKVFNDLNKPLASYEENRLRSMLESLVDAKTIWDETSGEVK